jgi:perosamine synthetase
MTLIPNSIPPAGNEIPLAAILRAIMNGSGQSGMESLSPLVRSLGVKYLFCLPSGRSALWLILKALSTLKPDKREVVIPAYTCPAVVSAVLKAGLVPVLVDIDHESFGFEREGLERMISRNTLAVILVHLFGFPSDIDAVHRYCKQSEAFLIEDSAQAFGNSMVSSSERKLGLQADAGFFSFGRGKPLSVMYGGLAVTNSDDIYRGAKAIYRSLSAPPTASLVKYAATLCAYVLFSNQHLYWIPEKLPFLRLGETIFEPDFDTSKGLRFPQLILSKMLEFLPPEQEIREKNSSWFSTAFGEIPSIRKPPAAAFPYIRYPLILQEARLRDRILGELKHHGLGAATLYPCPLNELPGLQKILKDGNVYSNSRRLSETLITLPVHSGVTPEGLETIKSVIIRAINSMNRL